MKIFGHFLKFIVEKIFCHTVLQKLKTMEKIRQRVFDWKIGLSLDETTDANT